MLEGQTSTFLFPKAKQNVSVLNFPIWFADSLELELSGRLEGLDAFPGDEVLERLATSDKTTIVVGKQPDGKVRVTSGA